MTRSMGDVIHDNVPALLAVAGSIQLAGLYNTGSADIAASAADAALFTARGIVVVWIDQAYGDTPAADAHCYVFDVESGAFDPAQATALIDANTQDRPTVYVNQSNIAATVSAAKLSPRWRGDTWVALPGWKPGDPWPAAVQQAISMGAVIVAVQNQEDVAGAYDLSVVLDGSWPALAPDPSGGFEVLKTAQYSDGRMIVVLTGTDNLVYVTEQPSIGAGFGGIGKAIPGTLPFTGPVTVSIEMGTVGANKDVPSVFVQSADPPSSGNGDVFTTWKETSPAGAPSWASWLQVT